MAAANLGALCRDDTELDAMVAALAAVHLDGHVQGWADAAFAVLRALAVLGSAGVRSVGVPTWFYGHEPPNVFCDGIAKFFSNAVREDELLARCTAGLVILRRAGTVQELFQAITPRYYANGDGPIPPVVCVARTTGPSGSRCGRSSPHWPNGAPSVAPSTWSTTSPPPPTSWRG